jgi:hypothetical protein
MALQLEGQAGVVWQTDTKHRAGRVSLRPIDIGSLGAYRASAISGSIAATLAANAPLFSLRWTDATRKMLLTRLRAGIIVDSNITTAVPIVLEAVAARSFSASDSGGTALTLTGNNNKLDTSMGTTLVGDARIAGTAALTAGTRTLDTQGFGMIVGGSGTTAGAQTPAAMTDLFNPRAGEEQPMLFATNEGFIVRSVLTGPATGTFRIAIDLAWAEMTSYDATGQ